LKTARALGTNYVGADILFSEDYSEAFVLECQTDTGLPREERFDMIEHLMNKIIQSF